MYINRAVLLVVGLLLIFLPAIENWFFGADVPWYAPYQLWLLVVVATWWNQRSRYLDEL